jgi:mannose-6-phosphate isomerase-like protein (cupin superfamily)
MTQLLEIDSGQLDSNFAAKPFGVHHNLAQHELLSVESVAQLADQLPADSIEHNQGAAVGVVADGDVPVVEATPGEVARNIETNGCWMVLKNIEQASAYNQLLNETLNEVDPLVEGREGGMNLREGFVFLSAPNSKTPAHTDHEHNFLLQIRGSKQMNIGRFREVEEEQLQVEKMFAGERNMDRLPDDPTAYELQPGDGVYVPPNAPHWVVNGPAVSVSLSITFRTPITERGAVVHSINRRLRQLKVSPRPPGEHLATDKAKFAVHRAIKSLQRN